MNDLPLDLQLKIDEFLPVSPLCTIVPCSEVTHANDEPYFLPFETDWPIPRGKGCFIANERVAMQCDIDRMQPLCPELLGTDRRVWQQGEGGSQRCTNWSKLGFDILRDEESIYMMIDLISYRYERIGSIVTIDHFAQSALRCTSKHFAGLPRLAPHTTNCVFSVDKEVGPLSGGSKAMHDSLDLGFCEESDINERAHEIKDWCTREPLWDDYSMSVVQSGDRVIVTFDDKYDQDE